MNRRVRKTPEPISQLVGRVLGDLGLDASARVVRLAERWEEAVGPEIARPVKASVTGLLRGRATR